jgi:hypothetical protein
VEIEDLERAAAMLTDDMTAIGLRPPEHVHAAGNPGERPSGFGMKLVPVFARPIGVSLQVIGHRGRVDSGGKPSVEAFGKISAFNQNVGAERGRRLSWSAGQAGKERHGRAGTLVPT